MAQNSLGHSEFSSPLQIKTLQSELSGENLPAVTSAQFNEQREAICFDLESSNSPTIDSLIDRSILTESSTTNEASASSHMQDLLVRVEIDLDESLMLRMSTANTSVEEEEKPKQQPHKKIYLIESNRLKEGQNCISYSQLIEVDYRAKNDSVKKSKNVVTLESGTAMMLTNGEDPSHSAASHSDSGVDKLRTAYSKYSSSVEYFGYDFHDFIRLHRVNVSVCYANDSSVCSQKIGVSGKSFRLINLFLIFELLN